MKNQNFYDKQTVSSRIKANIVAKYFPSYCRIIDRAKQDKIIYLDLFSGPGIYKDGSFSTPILIANEIASDSNLSQKVQFMFNDNKFIEELKNNFNKLYQADSFNYEIRYGNKTVGQDEKIMHFLTRKHESRNPHPTLLFFDPWGYKGIDTFQLAKFLENWGNEIFLFVNIKRIHAAIENEKFDLMMNQLFPTSIQELRKERRYKATVHERLSLIMDNIANEFNKQVPNGLFHSSFKFQEEDSIATSHYIIHFTKHSKGYELVKQIYHDFDNIGASLERDGVYTFDAKRMKYEEGNTFNFGDSYLVELSTQLLDEYKGKQISAKELFANHNPKTKYCGTHYAKTLRYMVKNNQIESKYTDEREHKVSVLLTESCILKFNN